MHINCSQPITGLVKVAGWTEIKTFLARSSTCSFVSNTRELVIAFNATSIWTWLLAVTALLVLRLGSLLALVIGHAIVDHHLDKHQL